MRGPYTPMADTQRLRPNARARAAALREKERKREARRRLLIAVTAVVAVVAVIGVLVGIRLAGNDKKSAPSASASSLDPAIAAKVTAVPAATLDAVGQGGVKTLPKGVSGSPLVAGSKPKVIYVGADYCPFCAAERWPVVVALSRFGTWKNLSATTSAAAPEAYPNTPTFSFHGASYSSPYVAFEGTETNTNKRAGNGYEALDKPTAEQQQVLQKYQPDGTIPFVDFGNRYVTSGASFSPQVLGGKSMTQIATDLSNPTSDVAKGVGGTANAMTAVICQLTKNQPSAVCSSQAVAALRGKIGG